MITGTALVAFCMAAGKLAGRCLGALLGPGTDIGGVGIAMVLLLLAKTWLERRGGVSESTTRSISFWRGMYIPVVVAMACTQNVISALSEGLIAVLAGVAAVGAVWLVMALLPSHRGESGGHVEI